MMCVHWCNVGYAKMYNYNEYVYANIKCDYVKCRGTKGALGEGYGGGGGTCSLGVMKEEGKEGKTVEHH